MIINPIAREIVIDGDDCVEHAASPFFLPYSSHATSLFNRLEFFVALLCPFFHIAIGGSQACGG